MTRIALDQRTGYAIYRVPVGSGRCHWCGMPATNTYGDNAIGRITLSEGLYCSIGCWKSWNQE